MLKFVAGYFSPYKKGLLLVLVCSVLTAVSELSTPYFTAKFIDEVLVSNSFDVFYIFMSIIACVCISAIIANYAYIIVSTKIQFLLTRDLVQHITEHIQKLPTEYLKSMDMVYVSKRIEQDSRDLVSFVLGSIIDITIQLVVLSTTVSLLLSIDVFWGVIFISIVFFHLFGYKLLKNTLLKLSTALREKESIFFSSLAFNYIHIYSIKLHSLSEEFIGEFCKKYQDYYVAGIKKLRVSFWFTNTRFNSGRIFNLIIFLIGGHQVLVGEISVGNFVALNGYFFLAMDGIYFFMNIGQGYQNALSAYNRITEILAQPITMNGTLKIDSIERIDVVNVLYSLNKKNILRKISFSLRKGHIYCLVGRNGAGKSTLINILVGMCLPTEGFVQFDGVDTKQIDMIDARKKLISIAEQQDFIPYDDPEENLSFDDAINIEQQSEFIRKFYLFNILEEGRTKSLAENSLSGGEKKKIALIRALSQKSDLLILDEPDNNLDSSSLSFFLYKLSKEKMDRIVVIVSHEPRIMEIADEIIELPCG